MCNGLKQTLAIARVCFVQYSAFKATPRKFQWVGGNARINCLFCVLDASLYGYYLFMFVLNFRASKAVIAYMANLPMCHALAKYDSDWWTVAGHTNLPQPVGKKNKAGELMHRLISTVCCCYYYH